MPNALRWKTDNYKFVGKAFDYAYANRINKLLAIMSEDTTNSIDYKLEGAGGFGEMMPYDGTNLNQSTQKRGFYTVITPEEFSASAQIKYKDAKNDQSGECRKVGTRLGQSAGLTVFMHALRLFSGAYDVTKLGGDGKPWAASDHPVASIGSEGRKFIADPDAGTFSNLVNKNLSVSAISDVMAMAGRFVCPDGLPFLCNMDTLLVSQELEETAKKICGENAKLYPGEVDNVNPVQHEINYIVVSGGADGLRGKQWALCDKKIMKEVVKIIYNTKPMVLQNELDNPLIDQYTAYADFAMGWGDARQIVFSTGA